MPIRFRHDSSISKKWRMLQDSLELRLDLCQALCTLLSNFKERVSFWLMAICIKCRPLYFLFTSTFARTWSLFFWTTYDNLQDLTLSSSPHHFYICTFYKNFNDTTKHFHILFGWNGLSTFTFEIYTLYIWTEKYIILKSHVYQFDFTALNIYSKLYLAAFISNN